MIISKRPVLTSQPLDNPNLPRLCWRNFLSANNVSATSATDNNPVTNLANSSTAFGWEATSTAQQDIDIDTGGVEIDYIGFARHNLSISAEYRIQLLSGASYVTAVNWQNIPNKQVILEILNNAEPDGVRISIRNNAAAPKVAVIYVGLATVFQRGLYVGHTPAEYAVNRTVVGGMSESGQWLGEVVRRETLSTSIDLPNLEPSWYRGMLHPFISQSPRNPAFFAWRPESYPNEVAFIWLTNNPKMTNQLSNGFVQTSLKVSGIT